ncbi:MAG: hypothetical protein ACJATN_001551 [Neolewinella sp.]|jgi:hypothetical protein|nr:hypothetical protein [Lewinella sp.]
MEALLQPYFTWANLFTAALLLWGVYWLLVLLLRRMRNSVLFGRFQQPIVNIISTFLLLYEPITIMILTFEFLFINPVMHGTLLLLLTVASFSRVRDYLSGRIILATTLVAEGKRMKTAQATGVISRIGRIGLYLQTGDSLHFVNYSNLITEGYSLSTGQEVGGYYQLNIKVEKDQKPTDSLRELADKFLSVPYLDRTFKPEFAFAEGRKDKINARVSVREEQHLRMLLELMEEWGYPATLAKR